MLQGVNEIVLTTSFCSNKLLTEPIVSQCGKDPFAFCIDEAEKLKRFWNDNDDQVFVLFFFSFYYLNDLKLSSSWQFLLLKGYVSEISLNFVVWYLCLIIITKI